MKKYLYYFVIALLIGSILTACNNKPTGVKSAQSDAVFSEKECDERFKISSSSWRTKTGLNLEFNGKANFYNDCFITNTFRTKSTSFEYIYSNDTLIFYYPRRRSFGCLVTYENMNPDSSFFKVASLDENLLVLQPIEINHEFLQSVPTDFKFKPEKNYTNENLQIDSLILTGNKSPIISFKMKNDSIDFVKAISLNRAKNQDPFVDTLNYSGIISQELKDEFINYLQLTNFKNIDQAIVKDNGKSTYTINVFAKGKHILLKGSLFSKQLDKLIERILIINSKDIGLISEKSRS